MPVRHAAAHAPSHSAAHAPAHAPAHGAAHASRPSHAPAPGVEHARPTRPTRSRRRRRVEAAPVPLGSLTQRDHRPAVACQACGSAHVTRLSMNLTDGTPVDFTSCHRCEHRTWEHEGSALPVEHVLERTRKV